MNQETTSDSGNNILERLEGIRKGIAEAAARSGRDAEAVTLLAVSKTVGEEAVQEAFRGGVRAFGENRVQEYLRKSTALTDEIRWHFIGRLQTNKVRMLAGRPLLIHSLDRLSLLEEMVRISKRTDCSWEALVEVNVSGEASKAGVRPEEALTLVRAASKTGCVGVKGLMTVAPPAEHPEASRPFFRKLMEIAIDIGSHKLDNVFMEHISSGMSNDYLVAVEEGATIVRIGTAIFGKRA